MRGQRIRSCRVMHAIATRPQPADELCWRATGRTIREVRRRGKYLLFELDQGYLVMHFRLSGQLFLLPHQGSVAARREGEPEASALHIDVELELACGRLCFADIRHLGRVHWLARPADSRGITRLGIDPLAREFTRGVLGTLLGRSKRPLKNFLMDQEKIAGIGNIYSSEALWYARLSPRRRANRVATQEVRRLHKAIVNVLGRALECCLHPAPALRNPQWAFEGLEKMVRVYQRAGRPCPRCGRPIKRLGLGGRSSFFCPGCQR